MRVSGLTSCGVPLSSAFMSCGLLAPGIVLSEGFPHCEASCGLAGLTPGARPTVRLSDGCPVDKPGEGPPVSFGPLTAVPGLADDPAPLRCGAAEFEPAPLAAVLPLLLEPAAPPPLPAEPPLPPPDPPPPSP